jgi:large subunit ribosomal protein L17
MRHRVAGRKFGRNSGERKALYRNLIISVIQHDGINTTEAKAKTIRPMVEKLITLAKNDTPANRKVAMAHVPNEPAVKKLFEDLGPKYRERPGGYTRIYHTGFRVGDAAAMARITFV